MFIVKQFSSRFLYKIFLILSNAVLPWSLLLLLEKFVTSIEQPILFLLLFYRIIMLLWWMRHCNLVCVEVFPTSYVLHQQVHFYLIIGLPQLGEILLEVEFIEGGNHGP